MTKRENINDRIIEQLLDLWHDGYESGWLACAGEARKERKCCRFISTEGDFGVCSACNSQMYDGDNFCPNCGAEVER